jgi:LDH2 family malate/lactate/ureidoglycolate dehydrogenase
MQAGDVCLIYGGGAEFRWWGRVLDKLRDASAAMEIWGTNARGETWEYMYFLEVSELPVPMSSARVAGDAGYDQASRPRGFTYFSENAVRRITAANGSTAAWINGLAAGKPPTTAATPIAPSPAIPLTRPFDRAPSGLSGRSGNYSGPDPDTVGRGLNAHRGLVNALGDAVRGKGFLREEPNGQSPNYDLSWDAESATWIVEAKSLTLANQTHQLRLGLGQLLEFLYVSSTLPLCRSQPAARSFPTPHTLLMKLVPIDDLRRCLAAAFERLELNPEDAGGLAWLLVDSELRGHCDHGIAALGLLTELYRDGKLNPCPQVRVLRETDGALLLDGDRGCGPGAPTRAMRWCIERAQERKGMAVAAVRDWQLLVAAPYARLAAEAGLIGFACTNFIPLVAPPGGRSAVFGTNPFAYGLPAQRHPPVVLDVATTVVAMQKVRVAAREGEPMPEGLIFDRDGRPTTDPAAFFEGGSLAPLGTPHAPHKGFGLALFIDALSGVLSGAGFAQGVATGAPGNLLWALDVEAFLPRREFLARMDAQIDQVKQGERTPGVDELLVPGERGERRYLELTARGVVPLAPTGWQMLTSGCEALGVPLPAAVDDAGDASP